MTHDLHTASCAHDTKSKHLVTIGLTSLNPSIALLPFPSGRHCAVVCVWEFPCAYFSQLFICCFRFYILHMSEIIWFLTFSVWLISKKMWYIQTIAYYSAIRKDKTLLFVTTWVDLESSLLWELHTSSECHSLIIFPCSLWCGLTDLINFFFLTFQAVCLYSSYSLCLNTHSRYYSLA